MSKSRGSVTLDEAIRLLPEILERLRNIESKQDQIISFIRANCHGFTRPLYDIDQLMELGISRNQGYEILRTYGKRMRGRLRVTQEQLVGYYSKEVKDG